MVANSVLPAGWIRTGAKESRYSIGLTDEFHHSGDQSAYIICSTKAKDGGFGTLMQSVKAAGYRGGPVTLSAWLKTEDVTGWAGLWLRVDGDRSLKKPLQFENMFERKVTGTTDWTKYEVVLPVAPEAMVINFGGMLCGAGNAYLDDFTLLGAPDESLLDLGAVTFDFDQWVNDSPVNMDFSQ